WRPARLPGGPAVLHRPGAGRIRRRLRSHGAGWSVRALFTPGIRHRRIVERDTQQMELSYLQKREIYENGYVHLPGVVPRVMVDAALRAINHSVGEGMNADEMVRMRAQTYCRELTG